MKQRRHILYILTEKEFQIERKIEKKWTKIQLRRRGRKRKFLVSMVLKEEMRCKGYEVD